jgi:hypothetical protein
MTFNIGTGKIFIHISHPEWFRLFKISQLCSITHKVHFCLLREIKPQKILLRNVEKDPVPNKFLFQPSSPR